MEILFIVLISLVAFFIVYSIIIATSIIQFSVRPLYESRDHARKNCVRKGYLKGTEGFKREPFEITLRDGYLIHADVSINDPKKVMIVCHGHCGNRETVMKYARIFFNEGYSIVLYDQRGHGDNKPTKCLMGKNESKDLIEIISVVKEKFKDATSFGIFGVSMGGSFTLMALKQVQDLDFCIIDCSFADVETVFKDMCHRGFLFTDILAYPIAKLWMKIFHKTLFDEIRPRDCITKNKVPLLFIHGGKDTLIYPHNQEFLIKSLPEDCYYENSIFEKAKHDNSVNNNPERYKELVHNFINHINNKERKED